ncbi:MAG TPA: carboxypeptidase-like regulatory domain-containing protein [Planctomycetota bacterium]|nr:carboxypeptidase-like regulatory domain-containing protein [Planctomycetota bacterium]
MARQVLLVTLALAAIALALWGFAVVGSRVDDLPGGPDADAPATALVAGAETPPDPAVAGLAGGAPQVVARSRPPTVDGPRITGRVTDRAGKGIAQAHVISAPDTATKPFGAAEVGTEGSPAVDAVTDGEGRFAVAVGVDAPFHALIAQAAGFGSTVRQNVATGADVTIVLEAGASIVGAVTDPQGASVRGAKVRLYALLDLYRHDLETATGSDGGYRFEGVPALRGPPPPSGSGVALALEVTAEGFAPLLIALQHEDMVPAREVRRDVVLVRGARVSGRVLEAGPDRPIPGARVVLWSNEGMGMSVARPANPHVHIPVPWAARALGETTTDSEGRYVLDHVPCEGFHAMAASLYGSRGPLMGFVGAIASGYVSESQDVPVSRNGATWEIDLHLRPGAVVAGRIVDGGGKPIAKSTITAEVVGIRAGSWFPTGLYEGLLQPWNWDGVGDDGRYRLVVPCDRAGPVEAKLTARRPRAPGKPYSSAEDGGQLTISVTAGATTAAPDLVLGARADDPGIVVLVRTEVGRPIFGAVVTLAESPMSSRTDASGRARVSLPGYAQDRKIAPGSYLSVRAPGFAPLLVPLVASALGSAPTEVILKPGRRLAGRVVRSDGSIAAGASVVVKDGKHPVGEVFEHPGASRPGSLPPSADGESSQFGWTFADAEGRFEIGDLPDGPYHVAARPAGVRGRESPALAMGFLADVPSDSIDLLVRLPAAASAATGSIEWRVLDAKTKRPVPLAVAHIEKSGLPASASSTDREGVYGDQTSPGTFEVREALAGTWTLLVTAPGYLPTRVENVLVRAAETTRLDPVEMHLGIRVHGRFRAPHDATMAGRVASFQNVLPRTGEPPGVVVPVASDGTFDGTGFVPGTWRFIVYHEHGSGRGEPTLVPPTGEHLQIPTGERDVAFDATLLTAGHLRVQPLDERLPVPPWQSPSPNTEVQTRFGESARVVVRDSDGKVVAEQRGLQQGHGGAVQMVAVAPGTYVVRYEAPGDEPRETAVPVASGETTTVEVTATSTTVPPRSSDSPPAGPMACGAGKCG